ncbi:MAG: fibronectin type III domain-containing protein [Saprospiraceae bacterium]
MFETNTATNAEVHFGSSPFNLSQIVVASGQEGSGTSRIYTAHLTGLEPLIKYYYKVVLENNVQSNVYHLITLDTPDKEQNINFISVSDMQRQGNQSLVYYNLINNGVIPMMNQELEGGLDNLHGMIIPGDLVQSGGTYTQWKNDFFDQGENLSTTVPLYPSLGNHEYYNNGLANYLKYFDLPNNGHPTYPEQWWYKDFSNIRVIALNSNSNTSEQGLQITWLNNTLDAICADDTFDFVFVQLHHPFKSEMWTPGEHSFTGQVISILEGFTNYCGKPTIHLFGHTHGYSRGQSKFHEHLWINVATAGGAIDYWGAYPNHDYEEFSHSEDEYGFVLLKGQAGPDPEIVVKRYSRGDDNVSKNNIVTDSIILKKLDFLPRKPLAIWPNDSIDFNCVQLKASSFFDPHNFHQASQWQVSTQADFSTIVSDVWRQHENTYNNTDSQINDDLTDEVDFVLTPGNTYFWRVRYRDNFLRWSPWSDTMMFVARNSTSTPNLLINGNAENGISSWSGDIESLTSNQCNSVPVYLGDRFFGVGGICAGEQDLGLAVQIINVVSYATQIDNGDLMASFGGYMRTWATNNDFPEMALEFILENGQIINTTYIGNNLAQWLLIQEIVPIPPLTRRIKVVLRGSRLSGGDNDSYFDELFLKLAEISGCPNCIGKSNVDMDSDGFCDDLDCDDNLPTKYPGSVELCDQIDNNCDGITDTGTSVFWTGQGDGFSWMDPNNWGQMMTPLPCQHVFIQSLDTVIITGYQAVKSLTVGSVATCIVEEEAQLIIDTGLEPGISGLNILGLLENNGRVDVIRSLENGLVLNGILNNFGRMYYNGISLNHILSQNGSLLDNQGLIINK